MKTISLSLLASTCIDAGRQGCQVIRSFHQVHQNAKGGKLKIGGDSRSVVTQCDIDAQAKIIIGLRETWGDEIMIIGEEDDAEGLLAAKVDSNNREHNSSLLRKDILFDNQEVRTVIHSDLDEEIPIEELVIFVDPVDGTREFVEGRLQNVACLIGIARNSRPIVGVIGVPFPDGDLSSEAEIHYAVADQIKIDGVWPHKQKVCAIELSNNKSDAADFTILTGDSSNPVLKKATNCARSLANGNVRHSIIGGTAAKLRLVSTSTSEIIAILHFDTELWDTCAAEALLNCKGGKITDFFGAPLVHCPKRKFGNVFGVIASLGCSDLHDELCRSMRADGEVVHKIFKKWIGENSPAPEVSQAIDIARDLDGVPYGLEDLQQLLKNENPLNLPLIGYSVPEEDAWRGLMSNGVRYKLDWKGQGNENSSLLPPSDIFYKRIDMAHLAHAQDKLKTAPHKLVRDVQSYQVETSFLTSEACRCLVNDTGMRINKVLGSDLRPVTADNPKDLLDSRFSMFLEYFQKSDGWEQNWLLNKEETKAALGELAKIHGYFWQGSHYWERDRGKEGDDFESIVWPNGGYMQPKLQGYDQLKRVRSGWEARYPSFQADLKNIPELNEADIQSLGRRLEEVALIVGKESHPFSEDKVENNEFMKYRTLIHGDPKHANFFFRRKQVSDDEEEKIEVGVIDFQWSGFGLAATDVAHHITSATSSSAVSLDGKDEGDLLDHYHSCLSKELVKFGVGKSVEEIETSIFPREVLQNQYEVAVLDVCRIVFAYSWRRWKAEDKPSEESFNRNAYNKSLDSVLWLITRCHVLLDKYNNRHSKS